MFLSKPLFSNENLFDIQGNDFTDTDVILSILKDIPDNLNKEYTYAYWIKLDNYNFFTWLIFILFTITGLILCRRHFIKTKAIWNEIMEDIKIELKQ